jgi:hypothetical protein
VDVCSIIAVPWRQATAPGKFPNIGKSCRIILWPAIWQMPQAAAKWLSDRISGILREDASIGIFLFFLLWQADIPDIL